ncbi:zinc finger protein OZF-like [Syngnathoides biaculeatus]|uniref:zinc finger protein OZF-like n=1 Tax=Syngnathoides biaculeatus TaxID=300417 RepID=UPI002ADDC8FB|nr:zinc finger protein OZF-like [Syngnathoides biaculeatus]
MFSLCLCVFSQGRQVSPLILKTCNINWTLYIAPRCDGECDCCMSLCALRLAGNQFKVYPASCPFTAGRGYSTPTAHRRKSGDRRVKMCARTTGVFKEEVCGPKKEERPQHQLLDAVFNLQPRIVLRRAEISENLYPEWHQSVSCHIKGEKVQHIKEEELLYLKEEEQDEIIQVPSTGVHLKSKDEAQNEERRGAKPPSSNHSSDGECNSVGLRTDGQDNEQSEGDLTCHTFNECWKCSQCRKAFASLRNLERHMKLHTGEKKPLACSVCGQSFTWKEDLEIHTTTHTGGKPFFCLVCGQRFTRKGNLKIHTRIHTGERPFSCSDCGKRFSEKGTLKVHTRTHTGEKPFFCSVCGQRFTRKEDLKIHTIIHTGEKPFSCSVCGQRFAEKGSLKIHTRIHTGEKPFSCSLCGKRFAEKGTLKVHTRTHTGDGNPSTSYDG